MRHASRRRVHQALLAAGPLGRTPQELSQELSLDVSTVYLHLSNLAAAELSVRTNRIVAAPRRGSFVWVATIYWEPSMGQGRGAPQSGPESTRSQILECLQESPSTGHELSSLLEVPLARVRWHLHKLRDEGRVAEVGSVPSTSSVPHKLWGRVRKGST